MKQGDRVLVIYKSNSMDGFITSWLFHRMFDKMAQLESAGRVRYEVKKDLGNRHVSYGEYIDATFIAWNMNYKLEVTDKYDVVYMIGQLIPQEEMEGLHYGSKYVVINPDKHGDQSFAKNAMAIIEEYITPTDTMYNIAELMESSYHGFNANNREKMIALSSYRYDLQVWDMTMDGRVDISWHKLQQELKIEGLAIDRFKKQLVREHTKMANWIDLYVSEGEKISNIPMVNCTKEIANDVLANFLQDYPMAISWYTDSNNVRKYSFRSSVSNPNHINVGRIAKIMGGGGTEYAAGVTCDKTKDIDYDIRA